MIGLTDITTILFLAIIMTGGWYVPIFISRAKLISAREEKDHEKKLALFRDSLFYHRTPEALLGYFEALFEITKKSENPHEELNQAINVRRAVGKLLAEGAFNDYSFGAENLVRRIEIHEAVTKQISNNAAKSARGRMRIVERRRSS